MLNSLMLQLLSCLKGLRGWWVVTRIIKGRERRGEYIDEFILPFLQGWRKHSAFIGNYCNICTRRGEQNLLQRPYTFNRAYNFFRLVLLYPTGGCLTGNKQQHGKINGKLIIIAFLTYIGLIVQVMEDLWMTLWDQLATSVHLKG